MTFYSTCTDSLRTGEGFVATRISSSQDTTSLSTCFQLGNWHDVILGISISLLIITVSFYGLRYVYKVSLGLGLEFGLFIDFSWDKMTSCQFETSTNQVYMPRSRANPSFMEKRSKFDWCDQVCLIMTSPLGYHLQEYSRNIFSSRQCETCWW